MTIQKEARVANSRPARKNNLLVTISLIVAALAIAVIPMFFNFGDPSAEEQFVGTDSAAEEVIAENAPDYEPWAAPLVGELPGEVESGLFALQAAIGAGLLGYALGFYRGRSKGEQNANDVSGSDGPDPKAQPNNS